MMAPSRVPRSGRLGSRHGLVEVDAVRNPTELFLSIESENWEAGISIVQSNPIEARVWVSRRNPADGLVWKYLPLHLICLRARPPYALMLALLHVYPKGASLPTPHDGNLPIHMACESGCEDENFFVALRAAFPQGLEVKNAKGQTPLLMCRGKTRGVLMRVFGQRKPLPFSEGQQQNRRGKGRKGSRRGADQRHDNDTTWRQTSNRRPAETTPARYVDQRGPRDVNRNELEHREDRTPKASNHQASNHHLSKKKNATFFAASSSGEDDSNGVADISSKTSKLALSAPDYLYPVYAGGADEESRDKFLSNLVRSLTKENADQKRTIEQLTSSCGTNTDSCKLCERILAKAEADSVAFRTQIQKLEDQQTEMTKALKSKEVAHKTCLDRMRTMLDEKGSTMKIDVFSGASTCHIGDDDQVAEGLNILISHMDDRNNNLQTTVKQLEKDLSKSEVALKVAQSKNHLLQDEKGFIAKKLHELERKMAILKEEKGTVQTGLGDLKDRVCTLTVINQSLQEQIDSMSNSQIKRQNEKFQSELTLLNTQLAQMKEEKVYKTDQNRPDRQHVAEMEEKVKVLTQKNSSLKETILLNNEKYSKKIQELGEKYSALEKINARISNSDLQVHLGENDKLLYEL